MAECAVKVSGIGK